MRLLMLRVDRSTVVQSEGSDLPGPHQYDESEGGESAIDASLRQYLDDPEEDIYTLEDGEPIEDEA